MPPKTVRPTLQPTRIQTTQAENQTIAIETGGIVEKIEEFDRYVLNATANIVLTGNSRRRVTYVIVAHPAVNYTIETFNNFTDIIDLSDFPYISTFEDLDLKRGSVIISFQDSQLVHISNCDPSQISQDNFLFANREYNDDIAVAIDYITIATIWGFGVVVLAILWRYHKWQMKHVKQAPKVKPGPLIYRRQAAIFNEEMPQLDEDSFSGARAGGGSMVGGAGQRGRTFTMESAMYDSVSEHSEDSKRSTSERNEGTAIAGNALPFQQSAWLKQLPSGISEREEENERYNDGEKPLYAEWDESSPEQRTRQRADTSFSYDGIDAELDEDEDNEDSHDAALRRELDRVRVNRSESDLQSVVSSVSASPSVSPVLARFRKAIKPQSSSSEAASNSSASEVYQVKAASQSGSSSASDESSDDSDDVQPSNNNKK